MQNITHDKFGSSRRRTELETLVPPLCWRDDWKVDGVDAIRADNTLVYVYRRTGQVECWKPLKPERRWKVELPGLDKYPVAPGTLLLVEEKLFASTHGDLYLIDSNSGSLREHYTEETGETRVILAGDYGCVGYHFRTGKQPSFLLKFESNSFEINWKREISISGNNVVKVEGREQLVVVDTERAVKCLELSDGSQVWSKTLDDLDLESRLGFDAPSGSLTQEVTRIACYDDTILVTCLDGFVTGLSVEDGSVRWCRDLKEITERAGIRVASNFLVEPDGVVTFSQTNLLARFDVQTGARVDVRPIEHDEIMWLTGLDATEKYFWGADVRRPFIYAIEKHTGRLAWSHRLATRGVSRPDNPVVVDGRLYVVDMDHRMFVFEPQS